MRLPIIKSAVEFIEEHDEDFVEETVMTLEHLAGAAGMKDEEIEVIGELISNLLGALEVSKAIREGTPKKEALNGFMKRVMGSIDK